MNFYNRLREAADKDVAEPQMISLYQLRTLLNSDPNERVRAYYYSLSDSDNVHFVYEAEIKSPISEEVRLGIRDFFGSNTEPDFIPTTLGWKAIIKNPKRCCPPKQMTIEIF